MVTFTKKISFLRSVFGQCELDRKQQNGIFVCPECGSGTGKKKFYINLDTWQCHCWSCGLKGRTVLSILKKHGTREDIEKFVSYSGIKKNNNQIDLDSDQDIQKIRLPEEFLLLADNQRSIDPDVRACIRYLMSRGVSERDLWRYRLGTAKSGRFKRRIIIPSFDMSGDLNFFVTRCIDPGIRRKYINSNVNKKNIVFNEIDIDWSSEIVLVEGPFDMMKSGINSTCILGSALRDDYLLFSRIVSRCTPVILALDSDMKEKEQKIAKLLSSYGCQVKIIDLGGFSDVGSMTKEDFRNRRKNAQAWDPSHLLKMKIGAIRSGSLL